MRTLLTLCLGNICRSPLSEALLARELPDHRVLSAGLTALVGQGADPLSVQVAADDGLDISAHRAQQVSGFLCQKADLVLVMDVSQKAQLEQMFPFVRGKVFRLGHYGQFDVADPYGQPLEAFQRAYAAIAQGVAHWAPRIRQLG